MSYTYAQYVTDLANLMVTDPAVADFLTVLPNIIDDAEQRIYRDLDLQSTIVRDASGTLSTNVQTFGLPMSQGRFVVVNQINVFSPAGSSDTSPVPGTRRPLTPASLDYINATWPSTTSPVGGTIPQYFAKVNDQTIVLGPSPGANFTVEVVGTIRPTPLSATNPTTYLTLYLPDLFMDASMVMASAFMRNFGAQSDNPQMAVAWEQKYQDALKSAMVEEQRKKFSSQGWTALSPAPIATPPRQ